MPDHLLWALGPRRNPRGGNQGWTTTDWQRKSLIHGLAAGEPSRWDLRLRQQMHFGVGLLSACQHVCKKTGNLLKSLLPISRALRRISCTSWVSSCRFFILSLSTARGLATGSEFLESVKGNNAAATQRTLRHGVRQQANDMVLTRCFAPHRQLYASLFDLVAVCFLTGCTCTEPVR